MSDGTGDEVDERLSRRFGADEQPAGADSKNTQARGASNASSAGNASGASSAKNDTQPLQHRGPENIKTDWNTRSVYLPEDIDDDLTLTFEQLRLQARQSDTELLPQKTRHYYPVLVELGRRQIEEMSTDEFERVADEIL